ncbi:MAG: cupin domain-containing protein [Thermoanaerobaculia bacterium]
MRRVFSLLAAASLTALLASPALAEEYAGAVTSTVVLKATKTAAGQPVVYPTGGPAEVTAAIVTIAPGAETGWHSHEVPVYAWVVAGTLRVEYDGAAPVTVRAGEPLVEAVGVAHDGRNAGTEPVKLLVFYTGIEGKPNVAKAARPAATPPR